ncbi:unnamed protein product [Ectocarpus sp. 12 AP-2014]
MQMMRGVTHDWFRSSKTGARIDVLSSSILAVRTDSAARCFFFSLYAFFMSLVRVAEVGALVPSYSPSRRGEWVAIRQYLQEEPSVLENTGVGAGPNVAKDFFLHIFVDQQGP